MTSPTPCPPPPLNIPPSPHTVRVQILNPHITLTLPTRTLFCTPPPTPHSLTLPSYSLLITHLPTTRHLLFDLSIRPNWRTLPPKEVHLITSKHWTIKPGLAIPAMLEDHGIELAEIGEVVWSHWHWDHLGDLALFPKSTKLIVGPGTKDVIVPGWPEDGDGVVNSADLEGREVIEVDFEGKGRCVIGGFEAVDWWGDESFYLLNTPGHAKGHVCGLARIAPNGGDAEGNGRGEFVFMGGDACHHAGEFRPSRYLPLPDLISPNPLDPESEEPCPGKTFEELLRDGDRSRPFYAVRGQGEEQISYDPEEAERTIQKVLAFDASEEVLVVMAHDDSLDGVVNWFPKAVEGFGAKGWKERSRWRFLKDFEGAVQKGAS